MKYMLQQAVTLFSRTVISSTENLLMFVVGNENIVAVRTLTRQYLTDLANTLSVTPTSSI